jgi:hypothetical protein
MLGPRAASVGNRAPRRGGEASGGVLPLRAPTTAADSTRDARAAKKLGRDRQIVAHQIDIHAVFQRDDLGDSQAQWHSLERNWPQQSR